MSLRSRIPIETPTRCLNKMNNREDCFAFDCCLPNYIVVCSRNYTKTLIYRSESRLNRSLEGGGSDTGENFCQKLRRKP